MKPTPAAEFRSACQRCGIGPAAAGQELSENKMLPFTIENGKKVISDETYRRAIAWIKIRHPVVK